MTSVAHLIRRRRARSQRKRRTLSTRRALGIVFGVAFTLGVLLPVGGVGAIGLSYYTRIAGVLPAPQSEDTLTPIIGASTFYDRTGQQVIWRVEDPLGDEREWLSLDDLPPYLIEATLLREDPDFLRTGRFAPYQTFQQLVYNEFQAPLGPNPTLTGRLVRNAIAPPPEVITANYRAREYILVTELHRRYTPQQILEWHLNTNDYGNSAYGIDAAARVYFDKRAPALSVAEAAMLAAVPTSPRYNPLDDETAARGRQGEVLRDLVINGVISQAQYNTATLSPTVIRPASVQLPRTAPDYAVYARSQAEAILNSLGYDGTRMVAREGLTITTALDVELFRQADCLTQTHLARLNNATPPPAVDCPALVYLPDATPTGSTAPQSGAVVIIDINTGEMLAAVGDITARDRQPGPVLHPFVYLKAFSGGLYSPARMVLDIPLRFPGAADGLIYTPENPDSVFRGPMNLREAMGAGLLPPVAQVANTEGLDSVAVNARQIGMSSLEVPPFDLSVLERGGRVSVLDATYAYTVLAGLGEMRGVGASAIERGQRPRDPAAVLRIEDAAGNVLWEYDRATGSTPIIQEGLAYLVNNVLADRSTRLATLGAGNVLEASRPMATVYGTAGDNHNWTVGYSPNLAVGVWLGRDDAEALTLDPYNVTGASTLWRGVAEYTHDRYGHDADDWRQPLNVVEARVCDDSGLSPTEACPQRTELFLEGTVPRDPDTFWETVTVNSQNGLLATANTPASLREDRVFFKPPAEAAAWWDENQLPVPPTEFDTLTRPETLQTSVILRPELLDYVGGQVDIRGSMDAENLQYYQLAYGEGLNPSAWTAITDQRDDYTPGQRIGTWDTSGLDGLYSLRLTAVMNDNSVDPFVVQVTVDNTPPVVALTAGEPGDVFTFLNDDTIPLTATVEDNVAIGYVEFYHNGAFVGVDEVFPFGYEHAIERIGRETFSAVVFDAAGNQASSEMVVEVLRGGT